jgi:hypothetical protein
MYSAITVRLPNDLFARLRHASRLTGQPMSRIVRLSLEKTLSQNLKNPLMKCAGVIKGGPSSLSSRKGFSRRPREPGNAKVEARKQRFMRGSATFSGPPDLSSRKGYSRG